ncbi:MAG: hypothetical protein JJV93_02695 [Alphaproteobacteria bacterium]|nr:hypothetical protein [Alphaproteobacteria bacterium]
MNDNKKITKRKSKIQFKKLSFKKLSFKKWSPKKTITAPWNFIKNRTSATARFVFAIVVLMSVLLYLWFMIGFKYSNILAKKKIDSLYKSIEFAKIYEQKSPVIDTKSIDLDSSSIDVDKVISKTEAVYRREINNKFIYPVANLTKNREKQKFVDEILELENRKIKKYTNVSTIAIPHGGGTSTYVVNSRRIPVEEQVIVHNGDLKITGNNLVTIKPNTIVKGNLFIKDISSNFRLPKKLKVEGHIIVSNVRKVSFSDQSILNGNLYIHNASISTMPERMVFNGQIIIK